MWRRNQRPENLRLYTFCQNPCKMTREVHDDQRMQRVSNQKAVFPAITTWFRSRLCQRRQRWHSRYSSSSDYAWSGCYNEVAEVPEFPPVGRRVDVQFLLAIPVPRTLFVDRNGGWGQSILSWKSRFAATLAMSQNEKLFWKSGTVAAAQSMVYSWTKFHKISNSYCFYLH